MLCDDIKKLIVKYFDETLQNEEFSVLDEHLRNCESCKTEFEEMKNLFSTLSDENSKFIESKEFYFNNLDALEIVRRKSEKKIFKLQLNPAFSLAMLLVVGFIFFIYFNNNIWNAFKSTPTADSNDLITANGNNTETIYDDYVTTYLNQHILLENVNLSDIPHDSYFNEILNMLQSFQGSLINSFYEIDALHLDELTNNDVQEIIAQLETKQF